MMLPVLTYKAWSHEAVKLLVPTHLSDCSDQCTTVSLVITWGKRDVHSFVRSTLVAFAHAVEVPMSWKQHETWIISGIRSMILHVCAIQALEVPSQGQINLCLASAVAP